MEYIPDSPNQYTEKMMRKRIHKLWWKLRRHKGFDILVTHAPAYKLNDMEDLPHRGFKAFLDLMDKYHPKYFYMVMFMLTMEAVSNEKMYMVLPG